MVASGGRYHPFSNGPGRIRRYDSLPGDLLDCSVARVDFHGRRRSALKHLLLVEHTSCSAIIMVRTKEGRWRLRINTSLQLQVRIELELQLELQMNANLVMLSIG
jgi:hypothetical protein